MQAAEPPRQELFRRLNSVADGTVGLVRMREALLEEARSNPVLKRVDEDFRHMFRSWFNRGFLVMRTVDWTTPAHILEKIIAYEAVHEIPSWEELRRRLEPKDRRCFAFFHPSMPDEPLIFVEVALLQGMPSKIADVLDPERVAEDPENAKTAVFYSISNCQKGLKGISFGNFLIKQVANDLQKHFPQLEEFATLSPLPGFMRWLKQKEDSGTEPWLGELFKRLSNNGWNLDPQLAEQLKPSVLGLCVRYLFQSERSDGSPNDPVARFHLENGASLERVNWLGDVSARGIGQGAGLMINYLYDLSRLEQNHELYAANKEVIASPSVKALFKETSGSKQSLLFPVSEEFHE
jgi:malonyl-CoA decarboxylase